MYFADVFILYSAMHLYQKYNCVWIFEAVCKTFIESIGPFCIFNKVKNEVSL